MPHDPDPEVLSAVIILVTIFTFGAIISLGSIWLQGRTKMKAIELLKVYAEKGVEPPASMVDTVARVNWPIPKGGPDAGPPATRSQHLARFAGSAILALGAAGFAWWRIAVGDPDSPLPVVAVAIAIVFAATAAARLVGALTTPDGDR